MEYFFYIVRCADNSLYCGITTNIDRRVAEHNSFTSKAAKYTRAHAPVRLVYQEIYENKIKALQREYVVKHYTKHQKEELILMKSHNGQFL